MARKVTDKQKANLKPFQKGHDPRRNLKGRPKSFDQLRDLAQQLANEKIGEGNITIVQDILHKMATDKKLMKDFLEFAYGKVPLSQIVDITSGGKALNWMQFINNDNDDGSTSEDKSKETGK